MVELTKSQNNRSMLSMDAAVFLAVKQALKTHKNMNNPVPALRDDRLEWVDPEDIPIE